MNLFFNIVYACWLLSEIILNRVLRSRRNDQPLKGKHSLTVIWIAAIGGTVAAGNIARYTRFPVTGWAGVGWLGIGLILVGMTIRLIAIISLGRFFTVDVAIRQGHMLKKDGVYKYVRHPAYTGSLLSFLGFGVSLNNWVSLLVVVVPVTAAFLYRIRLEEEMLEASFGAEYKQYKKETYRLLPGVY
jgi:protein-S-isoprenylcysteine O-methyltransferase Ste14